MRLFDDNFINDNNTALSEINRNEYYNEIIKKISSNKKLTQDEKEFIWTLDEKLSPKTKNDLHYMIYEYLENNITNLNFINTSNITDMSFLLGHNEFDIYYISDKAMSIDIAHIDIDEWDVSNVTNMENFAYNCKNFIADLSKWDVSKVINMSMMFYCCEKFSCDLSKWNVSNVKDMSCMFFRCKKFSSDLSNWDVSNVTRMQYMFNTCENFVSDLSKWNVSNVVNMLGMFQQCYKFISDLSNWNISKVEEMTNMFAQCVEFYANIDNQLKNKYILQKYNYFQNGELDKLYKRVIR